MPVKIIRKSTPQPDGPWPFPFPSPPDKPATTPLPPGDGILDTPQVPAPSEPSEQPPAAKELLPWEDDPSPPPPQPILQALAEFAQSTNKRKLYLVSKRTGEEFEVEHWDAKESRAVLHAQTNKARLRPVISAREEPKYESRWR